MEKVKKYSSDDVFDKWTGWLITEAQDIRYTYKGQGEVIEMLAGMFKQNDITHDEAKVFNRKVIMALTTPEGRKGTGKYKGWKENVEETFTAVLANFYVEFDGLDEDKDSRVKSIKKKEPKYEKHRYHEEDRLIVAWVKNKFKETVTKSLIKEAHLVFGALNIQFQEEVYEADWAANECKWPNWAKKACNKI